MIRESLWAPSGDPDDPLLFAAATAYKRLKEQQLPCRDEQDVINQLRRDNIEGKDYLADMPSPPATTATADEVREQIEEAFAQKVAAMTEEEVKAEYIKRRTAAKVYDARNSTSLEEELRLCVEQLAEHMAIAAMRDELTDPDSLNQTCLSEYSW
jgi:hypothetical protein